MSSNGRSGGSNIGRILAKLKASLDSGDYYHAHQLYRTLHFRLTAQARWEELIQLLFDGSKQLIDHRQFASALDLALLLIDTLTKANVISNRPDVLVKVGSLLSDLNPDLVRPLGSSMSGSDPMMMVSSGDNSDIVIDRNSYVQSAVKWSKMVNPEHNTGHPELHKEFARRFWQEKNYMEARFHFLFSHDGEGCALFLVEYHLAKGYPSEVDLFIAQAVLQFLCRRNTQTASDAFETYTAQHPQISGQQPIDSHAAAGGSGNVGASRPPFIFPLLDFIWLLLICIRQQQQLKSNGGPEPTGHVQVSRFTVLLDQYEPAISRDPFYAEYLAQIGHIFFGLPSVHDGLRGPGGFLGNILQNFLSSDDDDDQKPAGSSVQRHQHHHGQIILPASSSGFLDSARTATVVINNGTPPQMKWEAEDLD